MLKSSRLLSSQCQFRLEAFGCDLRPSWSCNLLRCLRIPALVFFSFFFCNKPHFALVSAPNHQKKKPRICSPCWWRPGLRQQRGPAHSVPRGRPAIGGANPRYHCQKDLAPGPSTSEDFCGRTQPARIPVVCVCTRHAESHCSSSS